MLEEIIAYILSLFVGITLGLVGAGGSILTVPILVYIVGIEPQFAATYAMFVVGTTSFVGTVRNFFKQELHIKSAIIFFLPSLFSMFLIKQYIMPEIPNELVEFEDYILTKDVVLMLLFGIVMIVAALNMIVSKKIITDNQDIKDIKFNYTAISIQGSIVGVLTALLGVGGGFLIVPALTTFAKLPLRLTIGTSLLIITINSWSSFLFDYLESNLVFDWQFLLLFSGLSIVGFFIGVYFSNKIKPAQLKKGFGYFILVVAIYLLVRQLFGAIFM